MSQAEQLQKQEIVMPRVGTIEHLTWICNLDTSEVTDLGTLLGFLQDNKIPESFSLLAFYKDKTPDVLTASQATNGLRLLDSRFLLSQSGTRELPVVRANIHQSVNSKQPELIIYGQSATNSSADYDTYDITIPLNAAERDIFLEKGLVLGSDPIGFLYALLSKKNAPASPNGHGGNGGELVRTANQLGPIAVKSYRSRLFDRDNQTDPAAFTEALKMAAKDLAYCLELEKNHPHLLG